MPQEEEILLEFDEATGNFEIKTLGFVGPACTLATKKLEQDLGVVTADERTADYARQPEVKTSDRNRLRSGH